jgi:putative membrane protein
MTEFYLASVFAQVPDAVGRTWHGPGPFFPLFGILWLVAIGAAVFFITRTLRPRERSGSERARDVLAERYARGEVSTEEYRERMTHLRGDHA